MMAVVGLIAELQKAARGLAETLAATGPQP